MTDSLTTKGVAKLLRVSEATVKRWANSGLLQPDKTVGGHRRFSLNAVAHLRRELGIGPGADMPSQRIARKRGSVILPAPVQFADTLLRADEKDAGAMLVQAYLSGATLATLFDETITKAMHHIGELWFKGSITVADASDVECRDDARSTDGSESDMLWRRRRPARTACAACKDRSRVGRLGGSQSWTKYAVVFAE
jgi:excisionase family DNA binding protein